MLLIPIIGLEIHLRLKTQTKMFCSCPNAEDGTPVNTAICPVCTGQPGALPTVNAQAIRLGVRAGLALNATIPDESHFDRKQYFYPDLPKGYQISQYDFPIAQNGHVVIDIPGGTPPRDRIRIGITRAHLEEDAAKNIHDPRTGSTLVDFNRAGQPLLEIVSEPDLRTPLEAKYFLQELQAMMRAINASDADMEKGYMRCDANISLLEVGENNLPLKTGYNPKTEIKNLNSFKAVERALIFEIKRQTELFQKGEIPIETTRGWDENRGETFEQRVKETGADYRYFPEPDLRPLSLTRFREEEGERLPELPAETRARLMDEWGFTAEDASFLVTNDGWATYAENVMSELASWLETSDKRSDVSGSELLQANKKKFAKLTGGWLTSKLAGQLGQEHLTIQNCNITPENFAEFLHLLEKGTINSANAQKLLTFMIKTGSDPSHLLEEHNLGQLDDPKALSETVSRLIEQNPEQIAQIKAGKLGVIKWLVGAVMKATEGRANPEQAEIEIKKQIGI